MFCGFPDGFTKFSSPNLNSTLKNGLRSYVLNIIREKNFLSKIFNFEHKGGPL